MGIPAFYRWLNRKYPDLMEECVEQKPTEVNGQLVYPDSSQPNPNKVEFDNFYLDMNNIIHSCTHPDDKPLPSNEDGIMIAIFEALDRLFRVIRPRKLFYMAIDGVAPKAKMNMQRARRFRMVQEAREKKEEIARIRSKLLLMGASLPPEMPQEAQFDRSSITPGTNFMERLSKCLRFYMHERLTNDPGWRGVTAILSDASVPGEGEHKILDYIRRQRAQPDYIPNYMHVLYGSDADLILLGLVTHELNFTIIRDEFKPYKPGPCDVCGQFGHVMKECTGINPEAAAVDTNSDPKEQSKFVFIRLSKLREYLEQELEIYNLPFPYDFERALDDWLFLCFLVGNDFLPSAPSMEIREFAIERIIKLYKKCVSQTGGWVTDAGQVQLERLQFMLTELGAIEDHIFSRRRENHIKFKAVLRAKKQKQIEATHTQSTPLQEGTSGKRSAEQAKLDVDDEDDAGDEVRFWQAGYKDRYYNIKFDATDSPEFRKRMALQYVRGLCWVLRYYFQGCPSWTWYYPYHYAPFISDCTGIAEHPIDFEKDTEPLRPLEQLMAVLPAACSHHVPRAWADLMTSQNSLIKDYYPKEFIIDMNGCKYPWQGVVRLPFMADALLLKALEPLYLQLTDAEKKRNHRGNDFLCVGPHNKYVEFIMTLYRLRGEASEASETAGLPVTGEDRRYEYCGDETMWGEMMLSADRVPLESSMPSPVQGLPPLAANGAVCVRYLNPQYPPDFVFPARLLPGSKVSKWNSDPDASSE